MKPTASELPILQHLWTEGPSSAREIHEGVVDILDWSYSSTRKTVERMVDKRMLTVEKMHGVLVYGARQSKVAMIASLARSFATDVLGIEDSLPVSTFAKSRFLTKDDLQELQQLLDEDAARDTD